VQKENRDQNARGHSSFRTGNSRDGIDWEVVCKEVGTRSVLQCERKWYLDARPSMKTTGEWSHGQDAELLKALWECKPLVVRILFSCCCWAHVAAVCLLKGTL
jgi:hypothetical protein